jgi:hypothetical protein
MVKKLNQNLFNGSVRNNSFYYGSFYGLVINKICNGHRDWLFSIIDIWGSIIILLVAYQLLLYKLRTSTIVYKGKKNKTQYEK